MKTVIFATVMALCIGGTASAQPPSWEALLNLGNLSITSVASDGYGQHLVGPLTGGPAKHYLYGNDGTLIWSTLSVTGGEYPVVTSYGGKVRVTMKTASNIIKVYQSTDGGSTWPTSYTYTASPATIYNIDAYSDANGTHIVWESNNSCSTVDKEIYYVRCDLNSGAFIYFKNVTDLASPSTGAEPKITVSANQAHVLFRSSAARSLTSRDLNISTGIWDASYTFLSGTIPLAGWVSTATIGDMVYAVGFVDQSSPDLGFTKRQIDAASWDAVQDIGNSNPGCPTDGPGPISSLIARNGTLLLSNYETGVGVVFRTYTPGGSWSAYETVEAASDQAAVSSKISSNQAGICVFYTGTSGGNHQHMRRKPIAITGAIAERTFLTGDNWFTGASVAIAGGVSVDARGGSETTFLNGTTLTISGILTLLNGSQMTMNSTSYVVQTGIFTVNNGAWLYVYPGCDFRFGTGKDLTVNGVLFAEGDAGNPINFTSNNTVPAPGDWYGIKLLSGSQSVLGNCNIRYAQYGIYNNTNNGTVLVAGEIRDCQTGVYNYYANASNALTIRGTKIRYNTNYGLLMINGWARLEQSPNNPYPGTEVSNNGIDGICTNTSSTLYLGYYANVHHNGSQGARLTGTGSTVMFSRDGVAPGYNAIYDNSLGQVYKNNNPTVLIGEKTDSWEHAGYNRISGDYSGNHYLVRNNTTTPIKAHLTYWGSGSCNPIDTPAAAFYGSVWKDFPQ